MRLKKLVLLGVAVTMFVGSTLNVSAAAGLKDIFDAKYYAEKYPDLKQAYGEDEKALYQHFVKFGIKENRNMSPILDVVAYRAAYPDLDKEFGDNWDSYVNHYLTNGYKENRNEGALFNPGEYAKAYADVRVTCGDNVMALVKHYKEHGRSENRTVGTAGAYASIAERNAKEGSKDNRLIDAVETSFGCILCTYNEFGQLIKEETVYNEDGIWVKEWDNLGRLTREAFLNLNTIVARETLHTYHPNSQLAKSVSYDYEKKTICEKLYDTQGKLISEKNSVIEED